MIKNLFDFCLRIPEALFNRSMTEAETKKMVMKRYQRLNHLKQTGAVLEQELIRLEGLLMQLGWIDTPGRREISGATGQRGDWQGYNWLAEGYCFGRDGLEPGCGQFLDWLEDSGGACDRDVLAETLEKLLRQVEVKRARALRKFTHAIPPEQQKLERCDISILFSRSARRRGDLRFLNAALKLNEWLLREINHGFSGICAARLLIALAEQEISARELLAC